MSLQGLAEKINGAVGDLATLSVETYTGNIKTIVDNEKSKIDWDGMFEDSMKTDGSGTVELLIASKFFIDGDAKLFTSRSDIPESIEAAHSNAIKAGNQIRNELIGFLGEKLIGKIS